LNRTAPSQSSAWANRRLECRWPRLTASRNRSISFRLVPSRRGPRRRAGLLRAPHRTAGTLHFNAPPRIRDRTRPPRLPVRRPGNHIPAARRKKQRTKRRPQGDGSPSQSDRTKAVLTGSSRQQRNPDVHSQSVSTPPPAITTRHRSAATTTPLHRPSRFSIASSSSRQAERQPAVANGRVAMDRRRSRRYRYF